MSFLNKISEKTFLVLCFISAFLVFSVQPLMGKILLPNFGGAPFVWNSSLFFFQFMLFAGYSYAFIVSKLFSQDWRKQAALHICAIGLVIIIAPLSAPDFENFNPSFLTQNQLVAYQFKSMFINGGMPYLLLCASTPLVQFWYSKMHEGTNPYHLFSISNTGSFAALISYPFVIEVIWGAEELVNIWWQLFIAVGCLFAFLLAINIRKTSQPTVKNIKILDKYCHSHRVIIILLSAVPSALLIGFSNFLTTDLAAAPLLWVIPLGLYLLTFVIAFSGKSFFTRRYSYYLQSTVIFLFLAFCMLDLLYLRYFTWVLQFLIFFLTCLVCHHELYKYRGRPEILNEFYILISFGGALGGLIITFVAPNVFSYPWEYAICLALSLFLRYASDPEQNFDIFLSSLKNARFWSSNSTLAALCTLFFGLGAATLPLSNNGSILISAFACFGVIFIFDKRWLFAISVGALLLVHPTARWDTESDVLIRERNYFGVTTVRDNFWGIPDFRVMHHGSTAHGVQSMEEAYKNIPLSYFYKDTAVGDIFAHLDVLADKEAHQSIGVLGLGIGSLSCYVHNNRSFDFYEINPAIIRIAQDEAYFSHLKGCGSPYQIIEGDARIKLSEFNGQYDALFIDAFSSDSIPMHLVTTEAFQIYASKLKDDGVLIVNITNRYLNLKNELSLIAESLGFNMSVKTTKLGNVPETPLIYFPATFAVLARDKGQLDSIIGYGDDWSVPTEIHEETHLKPWTDDHSFLLRAFSFAVE